MSVRQTPQKTPRGRQARVQRQEQVRRQQRRVARRRYFIGGAVILLLLVIGGGAYFAFARGSSTTSSTTGASSKAVADRAAPLLYKETSGTPRPGGVIDGISCQEEMLNYHIHALLTLYQNGQPVAVPAYVGIPVNAAIHQNGQNYCLYFLHTHDDSGVVHIESPTPQMYYLGQFFDVWRSTAQWDAQGSAAQQAGVSVDGAFVKALRQAPLSNVHVYVNGKPTTTYYKNIKLTAHKLITIELGKPLRPPTTHFDWPAGE